MARGPAKPRARASRQETLKCSSRIESPELKGWPGVGWGRRSDPRRVPICSAGGEITCPVGIDLDIRRPQEIEPALDQAPT